MRTLAGSTCSSDIDSPLQVAVNRTAPGGRVVGIDLIPAQPPRGVSTIQGNFLSPAVQAEVRAYVQDPVLGRSRNKLGTAGSNEGYTEEEFKELEQDYIDLERHAQLEGVDTEALGTTDGAQEAEKGRESKLSLKERDRQRGRVVDMVLSDMCEPWDQTAGFSARSLSDPYSRMANTSGITFKDHANSMVSALGSQMSASTCILTAAGSLYGCFDVCVRYAQHWRSFCLQILPGLRRQSAGEEAQAALCQSAPGEAGFVQKRKVTLCRRRSSN